jgi:two-component system, OmpR family, sensor kinase
MTSLKKQIIVWLVVLLAVVGVLAGAISYYLARNDASALLDQQLRLVARSIDEGSQLASMQTGFRKENAEEVERDFVIQVWYEDKPVRTSRPDFSLPMARLTGFSNMTAKDGTWRVYTIVYPNRTVQVSQSDKVRREIATSAAMRALIPIAGLIPLFWLLVAFVVGRILKPLETVTSAVTARDASSLDPLPLAAIPREILPLIVEMNALLSRLKEALESQRQFVSNAAHELRTPLAAMQLQIENLSQSQSPEDLKLRVDELVSGLQRASRLVNQLLRMARFEAKKQSIRTEVDLGEIVKSCIGDFIPLAEKKRIDLGMMRDDRSVIVSNADDLRILFNNLLDNAIRYIPEGGRIDVSLIHTGTRAIVEVSDNGPGIHEPLLPRVFDRFFRASGQETGGSGIGLAIVKAIASRESAEIELRNRKDGNGLVAGVSFPLRPAPVHRQPGSCAVEPVPAMQDLSQGCAVP